ncbi:hypothetical protein JHW43_007125 [Diplocarpon mali]|nr:hypothetical protein JHW43_007125 [Diplocarpon mali]
MAEFADYQLSLRVRRPRGATPAMPVTKAPTAVPKMKWVARPERFTTTRASTRAERASATFARFAELPPELQLMVWREAVAGNGRIVTLKRSTVPAVFHVCADSREEAIKAGYQICVRDFQSGYVIMPELDILFLDQTAFSASTSYHINSFHTLQCRKINKAMLEPVQRLALSVTEVLSIWSTICFHCFLVKDFDGLFPNLTELIIILRPGTLGSGYDDLYEVQESSSAHLNTVIRDIKERFQDAQEDRKALVKVQLRFMRIETIAD